MARLAPQSNPGQPRSGGGVFHTLGELVSRFRWVVVALWIAGLVVGYPVYQKLSTVLVSGGYEVPTSDSGRGTRILEDEFGRRTVTTTLVLFTSERVTLDDPNDPSFRDAVTRSAERLARLPEVKEVITYPATGNPRLLSPDRKTTYAILSFSVGEEEAKELTPHVRDELAEQPGGVRALLLGFPSVAYDILEQSDKDLHKAETISGVISLVLLLLVFGTLLSAGLPLILALFAVTIASALIYPIAQQVETSSFAKGTASMIGLGLGIDFSLLMVSRFREEIDKGRTPHQATVTTVTTAGRSIVFSAITVMLGLSVLLLYKLSLVRSIALGMLLVSGISMLAAVTLLPALMAIFGRRLNAFHVLPKRFRKPPPREGEGRWYRWSMAIMRMPWAWLLLTLVILLGLAYPARELNAVGVGTARTLPKDTPSRDAFDLIRTAFGEGEATPINIVVRAPNQNGAFDPATLEGVYRLVKKLEADPRVAHVDSLVSLAELAVPGITEAQFKGLTRQQLEADPRGRAFLSALVNVNGGADTHSLIVASKEDELGEGSLDLVRELRKDIIPSIPTFTSPAFENRCTQRTPVVCTGVYVTGDTALTLDYTDELFDQFPQLVGLVLLITYIVLLLFFHSLILPLKAVLMNIASILASYGVLVLVFQYGVGEQLLGFEHQGRLSMLTPVILFAILFGLSTDYEVFLLSRVREIYAHTGDNERSVALGLERTAGIITAAGLIMIVVFGSFALGSTLVIKELGVGLAVAVLLDSTIIRIIMVPASMKLMGNLNWWMPKWLDWIPQIKESEEEEPAHVLPAPAHGSPFAASVAVRTCPACGRPARPTARFCGVCGARLPALGMPAARPIDVDGGATVIGMPAVRSGAGVPAAADSSGVRRIPIMLSDGRRQQQAWLVLRDCQVEHIPDRRGIPVLQIEGLDLGVLGGSEPEIQIRNARVRM